MPFLKNCNRFTKDDTRLKIVEIKGGGGMDDSGGGGQEYMKFKQYLKIDKSKLYYILKRLIQFHSWLLIFHNSETGTACWTTWNGRAPPSCHPISSLFKRTTARNWASTGHVHVLTTRCGTACSLFPYQPSSYTPCGSGAKGSNEIIIGIQHVSPPPTTPPPPQPGPLSPLPRPLALSSLTWGGCGVTGSHSSTHSLFVSSYCINGRRPNYLALSFMTRDPQCPLCQIAMGDWKEKRKKKNQARKRQGNNKSRLESGKLRKTGSRCAQDASSITSQQNIIRWFVVVVAVVLFLRLVLSYFSTSAGGLILNIQ